MNIIDIIIKKKDKYALTKEEITYFVNEYVLGNITEYQASALLMAICINGMNEDEEYYLTKAMVESGDTIDLSKIKGICVDKHSTGGIGDKTSLVIGPILAACGLKVPKMSGRGLGFTGGTIDKLESIPNFTTELTQDDFINQVNTVGLSIIGQTGDLVPADKKLYALRDVSGTIDSISLIAASIMSKKIASGAPYILLDIKVGIGAFMKTVEQAEKLAKAMVAIGKRYNRQVVCVLTDMNLPLGSCVGNSLEVLEAINTLKGNGNTRFMHLCETICTQILLMTKTSKDKESAIMLIKDAITNKTALNKFEKMIEFQKGDSKVVHNYNLFKKASYIEEIICPKDAYISNLNALEIGKASMFLGAGRLKKEDQIDLSVGVELLVDAGDFVKKDKVIAKIYHNGKNLDTVKKMIKNSFSYSTTPIKTEDIIIKIID
ncbi:MAG: thymidine phosphorylase [Bacilli bacterium]|jgi:pyrimidine-nucleoside phosphorylase